MLFLRIKIDAIMKAAQYEEASKRRVRQWCIDMFEDVPVRRVWLYLKLGRNLPNLNPDDFFDLRAPIELDGPEDEIAKGE